MPAFKVAPDDHGGFSDDLVSEGSRRVSDTDTVSNLGSECGESYRPQRKMSVSEAPKASRKVSTRSALVGMVWSDQPPQPTAKQRDCRRRESVSVTISCCKV